MVRQAEQVNERAAATVPVEPVPRSEAATAAVRRWRSIRRIVRRAQNRL
jgi:nucleoid-associated protein YgaU